MTSYQVLINSTQADQESVCIGVAATAPASLRALNLVHCALEGQRIAQVIEPVTYQAMVRQGLLHLYNLGALAADASILTHIEV
jgi:hypothetical protein